MIPPYLASLGAYRAWMRARLAGASDAEAWRRVADGMSRAGRRCLPRTLVAGAHGQGPLTLSVSISGGASVIKRGHPEEWGISMHGRWTAVHLGALDAAYSATPFYPHLRDAFSALLRQVGEGDSFGSLTTALHRECSLLLDLEGIIPALRSVAGESQGRLRKLAEEKSVGLHTDLAFLDVICRRGREAVFALL